MTYKEIREEQETCKHKIRELQRKILAEPDGTRARSLLDEMYEYTDRLVKLKHLRKEHS